MIGTCLRLEIGPRDIAAGVVTLSDRLTGVKRQIELAGVKEEVAKGLKQMAAAMLKRAEARQQSAFVTSYDDFKTALARGGYVAAPWGGNAADEAELKKQTLATARCAPFKTGHKLPKGSKCFFTGKKAERVVYFAIAY